MLYIFIERYQNEKKGSHGVAFSSKYIDSYVRHPRISHINKDKMHEIHKNGLIPNMRNIDFEIYTICIPEKMTRKPLTKDWHSFKLLEIMYTVVRGLELKFIGE